MSENPKEDHDGAVLQQALKLNDLVDGVDLGKNITLNIYIRPT